MHARLTVISGAQTPHVDLRLPTIIGRGTSAKLKLPSSTVSRQHCEIYEYEGQIAVRDLGSSNGTIVNGHRIEGPTFVTAEDQVSVGPVLFRLDVVAHEVKPKPESIATPEQEPSLEELPPETNSREPVIAAETAVPENDPAPNVQPSGEEDESVLKYTEAKDAGGRSFVGIVPDDQAGVQEQDAPAIDGEAKPGVAADDSSLQSFFNNLDT